MLQRCKDAQLPTTCALTNLIRAFFYKITADFLIDYVEELMCNVALRREANPTYQLATASRFSCRSLPLAENYKGVRQTEFFAVTNPASISIGLIAVHWYRNTTGGFVLLFCSVIIFICF